MIPAAQSLDKGEDAQVGSDQQHVENKGRLQVLPVKQLGFQGPSELESMFCVPPSPYQSILPLPGRARLNTSISSIYVYYINYIVLQKGVPVLLNLPICIAFLEGRSMTQLY